MPIKITRRGFLAAGVITGAGSFGTLNSQAEAADTYTATLVRWVESGLIGDVNYIQFHCTKNFDLETAVITAERLTKSLSLEKVSALGDFEFTEAPSNAMASLYFKEGVRATISTAASLQDPFGTVVGSDGSIELRADRVELFHIDGSTINSVSITPERLRGASIGYPMILHALRKGVTVYPEK